jgi:SEC-C motif-containing protein
MTNADCPCGGGAYTDCCGRFHAGAEAPTAEALMRSRYAAFVRRDAAYLLRTSHPALRRKTTVRDLQDSFALAWCGLTILAVRGGGTNDVSGEVRFRASWRQGDRVHTHEESSRFCREAGAWVYRDANGAT